METAEKKVSAVSVSRQIIDSALTSGGNEPESSLRIAAYFKKDHSIAENTAFLKHEYETGGKGFLFDKTRISVWFDASGLRIAMGDTALNAPDATIVTWEQVANRTRELLDAGRYMPQSNLDKVDNHEIKALADSLWYLHHDRADGYEFPFIDAELFNGGFTDSTARIAELVSQPEQQQIIVDGLREFAAAYEQDNNLLRFRFSKKHLYTALDGIGDLRREPLVFTADESALSVLPSFITQDEIDALLTRGGNIDHGKFRIYSYFSQEHTAKEKADFLKDEYGIGGFSRTGFDEWHDSKGIAYSRENDHVPYDNVLSPWNKVAKRIDELIADGKYMSQRELDYIPEYEKDELARDVVSFFPYQPEDLPRPFPYGTDFIDSIKIVRPQLDNPERVSEILAQMETVFDNTAVSHRNYELMQRAYDELTAFQNGTFSLFAIPKPVEKETAQATLMSEKAPDGSVIPDISADKMEQAIAPKVGARYEIDGRMFEVDSVSIDRNSVDLRDITFEGGTGFPIFRNESIDFMRQYEPIKPDQYREPEPEQTPERPSAPVNQRHNFKITDDNLGVGGAKTKFRANIAAIRMLKTLESENKLAMPEEQEVLSRYVGWGGLQEAFDPSKKQWEKEYAELKNLLSPEEYKSAQATVLNAHYTSPVVIKAIWKAVKNMAQPGSIQNIVDPGCGTGNFQGLLPDSMSTSKVTGVEIDIISGKIARQLYQKNTIAIQGYEKTDFPNSFDVAVGNVPFGGYGVADPRYDTLKLKIHDYFFTKALDDVRPGGVIAFITSKGTMDKANSTVRRYIAQRAELLGAIRLPNNAFKANAGTEVTSDIIFLQKRDRPIEIEPDWIHLGKTSNEIPINSYFIDHPEMVLGEMTYEHGLHGAVNTACRPFPDEDLAEQLDKAIQNIHAEITKIEFDEREAQSGSSVTLAADPTVRNFSFTLVDGKVYYRENSSMSLSDLSATAENRVKGMIAIRDCTRKLLAYQLQDYSESDIVTQRAELNKLYDDFTKKHGLINSRANSLAFRKDSSYPLLASLEVLDDESNLKEKAAMFTRRTIRPSVEITRVDTSSEALAVSLSEKACVDLDFMSDLTGKTADQVLKDLEGIIFKDPKTHDAGTPRYLTADEYLSGNVKAKLLIAQEAVKTQPELDVNVRFLESVQPKDLTPAEISVRLGTTWIPPEMVTQFTHELLGTSPYYSKLINAAYEPYTAQWQLSNRRLAAFNIKAETVFGTDRINAYHIIEETLNLKNVQVKDRKYIDGKETYVLNKEQTLLAQAKQERIREAFQDWVWKDPARREQLCRIYNDRFNNEQIRTYDGSHLMFPGMNPEMTLRPHQKNGVARVLYGGNSLLAHVVGAGKSYTMIAAAMESKRLGLSNKSMVVVPNHLIEQFASDWMRLYPNSNILVASKKDFEPQNRKKFCARIATGDYDGIVIGQSQFEKIPVSEERQAMEIGRQMDALDELMTDLRDNRSDGSRFTVKQLQLAKQSLETKLERLHDQSKKDDTVSFEELGVDCLFVDEADTYKNLQLFTKMQNVGGISTSEAKRASDLYLKCCYLNETTGEKGVVFATGTPISNSMTELFTMQRYLQPSKLEELSLQNFDSWASTFGETVTAMELAPEGKGYRTKTRFAKFYNIPELMTTFRMVADIQTADMLNLPVPKANYHTVAVKPSETQRELVEGLAERAEAVRNGRVDSSEDNMLKITNDGRKFALDQRLMNPLLPDFEGSKVNTCVGNVFDIWQRTAENKSTQLIFSDLSTPQREQRDAVPDSPPASHFTSVYADIKEKLIARGVPEKEIAFIHDADSDAKKKELFAKVRSGSVRVLLGSTQKLGAGTNIQEKLIALHDLDCPWRPRDLEQRSGRIVRQRNENPEVHIYRYVTEGTFDSYLFQLLESKQRFISQIMTSKSPARSVEDLDEVVLSYAEIKALAAGNPLIKEKMTLDVDVKRLQMLRSEHSREVFSLQDKLRKVFPQEQAEWQNRITKTQKELSFVQTNYPHIKDHFYPMTVDGKVYTDKKEAGTALIEVCKKTTQTYQQEIGEYRGFTMSLRFDPHAKEHVLTLEHELKLTGSLGADPFGNITRIDNTINSLPDRLERQQRQLQTLEEQIASAETAVTKPFPQESEYEAKRQRLEDVNQLLTEKPSPLIQANIVNARQYAEGGTDGVWLSLPASGADLAKAFEDIGLSEQKDKGFFVAAVRCETIEWDSGTGSNPDMNELNFFAHRLSALPPDERNAILEAAKTGEHPLADLINRINTDGTERKRYSGIQDIPEKIRILPTGDSTAALGVISGCSRR